MVARRDTSKTTSSSRRRQERRRAGSSRPRWRTWRWTGWRRCWRNTFKRRKRQGKNLDPQGLPGAVCGRLHRHRGVEGPAGKRGASARRALPARTRPGTLPGEDLCHAHRARASTSLARTCANTAASCSSGPPRRTSKSSWPRCGRPSVGIVGAVRWVSFVSSTRSCGAGPITTATSWRAGRLRTWRWRCSLACGAGQDADTPNARVPGSKTVLAAGGRPERLRGPRGHSVRRDKRLGCGWLIRGGSRSGGTSRSGGKPTRSIPRGATTLKTGRSSSGSASTDLRLR